MVDANSFAGSGQCLDPMNCGEPYPPCTECRKGLLTAYRTRPAPETAGEADARGWSVQYRPGGLLHGFHDTQEDAQAEARRIGGTARPVALYTAPAPAQRMSEERISHLWNTRVGPPSQKYPLTLADWRNFARAVENELAAAWGVKLEGDAA